MTKDKKRFVVLGSQTKLIILPTQPNGGMLAGPVNPSLKGQSGGRVHMETLFPWSVQKGAGL